MSKSRFFAIWIIGVLALGLALVWLVFAAQIGARANGSLTAYELPLNPSGRAFEVNLDPQGHLWLSDYTAGEIWELDPVGRVYTSYAGMTIKYPGDARPDGNGSVWYAQADANHLGQLSLASGTLTQWPAPGGERLFGTQVDPAGKVWATDSWFPLLFRFDPASQEMCSYPIPAADPSIFPYIEADGQEVWLADYTGEFIFRLDPALNEFSIWTLPATGWPVGLDLDASGDLWWADNDQGNIHRLEADIDRLTTFDPPITSNPVMLDSSTNEVKFSDDINSVIGVLSPPGAVSSTATLPRTTQDVTPSCSLVEPVSVSPATVSTGKMNFSQTSYATLLDSGGWQIWEVPGVGAPYGVRASGKSTWVTDYVRRVLSWSFSGAAVSACKLADADGDLGTTGDQKPVKGWRVYLKVDGVRQEPGELTSAAGCFTWLDLDSGHTYAVEEDVPEGWTALTPSEHNFGTAAESQLYEHTFINYQEVQNIYLPLVIR